MTEPVQPDQGTDASGEQSIDPSAVEEVMRLMAKFQRAIMLYKPNNPVYQEAAEHLNGALEHLWTGMDELFLRVRDGGFNWQGHVVLEEPSKGDSLSWVLYKDGVLAVRITPGAEERELVRFLNLIHTVRTLPEDAEDDFRILLWAQNYEKIKCELAIIAHEDARPMEVSAQSETPPPSEKDVRRAVALEIEGPEGMVSLDEVDSTLHFLDDSEIEDLTVEIEHEYARDLRTNVLSMLFDVLELERDHDVGDNVVAILEEFLPYLLGLGDVHAVAYILREAHTVTERAGRLEEVLRERLAAFAAKLSDPGALDQLLQTLEKSAVAPADEDLARLFGELQPQALDTVLDWLPRLGDGRARELLIYAADQLATAHPCAVDNALTSEESGIVLAALSVVTRLSLKTVGPEIEDLSSHREIDVRRALADALAAVATPNAFLQLELLLDDVDRDVRIRAARHLRQHADALSHIEATISSRALRSADLSEKLAFFETYAALAGDAALPRLRSLLATGWWLSRKVDAETRACAVKALGVIATKEARKLLKRMKNEKDPLVRTAVREALQDSR